MSPIPLFWNYLAVFESMSRHADTGPVLALRVKIPLCPLEMSVWHRMHSLYLGPLLTDEK